MKPVSECTEQPTEAAFEVSDVESKVIFLNPNGHRVEKIKVDECVFDSGDGKRCDYLVNVHFTNKSYLVELKGSDVNAAYEQLRQTQETLSAHLERKHIWIVSHSGVPHYTTMKEDLMERVRTEEKAFLLIKKSPYTHSL